MKLTDPDPPPELAGYFAALTSMTPSAEPGDWIARTRRVVRSSAAPRITAAVTKSARKSAEQLAAFMRGTSAENLDEAWIAARADEIAARQLNPQYWTQFLAYDVRGYGCTPTAQDHPAPPPYAYRDESNLPTLPTYAITDTNFTGMSYTGETINGRFRDTRLEWATWFFQRPANSAAGEPAPMLLNIQGALVVSASNRTSRPMLSLCVHIDIGNQTFIEGWAVVPTTKSPNGTYWSYERPEFMWQEEFTIYPRNIWLPISIEKPLDPNDKIGIRVSPRPMRGSGYNNNTRVETSFLPDLRLYRAST